MFDLFFEETCKIYYCDEYCIRRSFFFDHGLAWVLTFITGKINLFSYDFPLEYSPSLKVLYKPLFLSQNNFDYLHGSFLCFSKCFFYLISLGR